jgi:serine/threonine-protein kinase HipA
MNKAGGWRLSPAFDVAYSYNPSGAWTSRHQMSVNGKRDGFDVEDLIAFAETGGIKPAKARRIIEEVDGSVGKWEKFAMAAGIDEKTLGRIGAAHRILA